MGLINKLRHTFSLLRKRKEQPQIRPPAGTPVIDRGLYNALPAQHNALLAQHSAAFNAQAAQLGLLGQGGLLGQQLSPQMSIGYGELYSAAFDRLFLATEFYAWAEEHHKDIIDAYKVYKRMTATKKPLETQGTTKP